LESRYLAIDAVERRIDRSFEIGRSIAGAIKFQLQECWENCACASHDPDAPRLLIETGVPAVMGADGAIIS